MVLEMVPLNGYRHEIGPEDGRAFAAGAAHAAVDDAVGATVPELAAHFLRGAVILRIVIAVERPHIVEIQIGVDGLAFAESSKGPGFKLTPRIVYEALAANPYGKGPNKAQSWKDVDPSLPAIPISVFGPPSTSGTRDSLAELILEKGCQSDEAMKALKEKNEDEYKATCTRIREDGKYVDSGENDNLIVQKLGANPNALGIFGFSFLEENKDTLKDVPINGVEATYETVSTGQYPGARPLYIYVKKAHMQAVPGLQAYLNAFAANWGPDGPLTKRGMVAAPDDVRKASAEAVKSLTVLDGSVLK